MRVHRREVRATPITSARVGADDAVACPTGAVFG